MFFTITIFHNWSGQMVVLKLHKLMSNNAKLVPDLIARELKDRLHKIEKQAKH
jgi:hypothetical protein